MRTLLSFKCHHWFIHPHMDGLHACVQMFNKHLLGTHHLPWRRQWHPTPVLLPRKSRGRRSLVACSPWGRWGSDTTERLHFHFSLSCIGEGHGNLLQCSCLENPRDRGAWWAAVYGVAQSRTRLKWLSSSTTYLIWFYAQWTSIVHNITFNSRRCNTRTYFQYEMTEGN